MIDANVLVEIYGGENIFLNLDGFVVEGNKIGLGDLTGKLDKIFPDFGVGMQYHHITVLELDATIDLHDVNHKFVEEEFYFHRYALTIDQIYYELLHILHLLDTFVQNVVFGKHVGK